MRGDIGLGIDMAQPSGHSSGLEFDIRDGNDTEGSSHEPAPFESENATGGKKYQSMSKADTTTRMRKTVRRYQYDAVRRRSQDWHTRTDWQTEKPDRVAMRASKVLDELLQAEAGATMLEEDKLRRAGTSLKRGRSIEPGEVTPVADSLSHDSRQTTRSNRTRPKTALGHFRGTSLDQGLSRQGTLLTDTPTSSFRRAEQLRVLLGDSSGKVKSGAVISSRRKSLTKSASKGLGSPPHSDTDAVSFEQGRPHARVTLDIELENNVAVEGGYISGTLLIRIRPKNKSDTPRIGGGKVRLAGFEVAPKNEDRFIFYQVASPLKDICNGYDSLFSAGVDADEFASVEEGEYSVRFSMQIPLAGIGSKPRGTLHPRTGSGAAIKYIIIASMKIADPSTNKRSIAHFYRDCEIWPALDLTTTLAPAPDPMLARAAKKLFMGGDGTLALTASLHRYTWIAGQPVHVRLRIVNGTKKSVRSVSLSIIRTTTLFNVAANVHDGKRKFEDDVEDMETCTSERRVAELLLTAGQKGAKGRASAKGWWTGVGPGETRNVTHSVVLPLDALTIPRARLVAVDFSVRVALSVSTFATTSEAVHVNLPVRIVNSISLDPPPSGPLLSARASSVSVIELDTPKQEKYSGLPPSGTNGWEVIDSPSEFLIGRQLGSTGHSVLHRYSRHMNVNNPSPKALTPMLATAHTVHDLGSIEDAKDLENVLGEIPGSTSLLEGTVVDSGCSEGGCSTHSRGVIASRASQRGRAHADRVPMDGTEESFGDGEEREEVGSEEELERMVGCASAQVDRGCFLDPYPMMYRADSSDASESGSQRAGEHRTVNWKLPATRRTTGGRAVRGPRNMVAPERKVERQQTEVRSETRIVRGECMLGAVGQETQVSRRRPQHSFTSPAPARSMLPLSAATTSNYSSRALVESPESAYPISTAAMTESVSSVNASSSRLMRSSPSKSLSQLSHMRHSVSHTRAATRPSNASHDHALRYNGAHFASQVVACSIPGLPVHQRCMELHPTLGSPRTRGGHRDRQEDLANGYFRNLDSSLDR